MCADKLDSGDLVMAQAELPPGIDAPDPSKLKTPMVSDCESLADVVREVRFLAERVGLARLKAVVDELTENHS